MAGFRGSGPGVITPDGCAVDFYALLPLMGEPEIVHAAVPPGASLLELGCGTGRLLRPLAALGHPVVGVDESAAMLAYVADLPTVPGRIETLDLGRDFDVVLLASTMINTEPELRQAFLAACRRHVGPEGVVVFQQAPADWFATVEPSEAVNGDIRRVIASVDRRDPQIAVVVEYHVGPDVWTHEFERWPLPDLAGDLARAGLRFDRTLTDDGAWFTARRA
jgi:SAM-dependent methyltransferase